MPTVIAKQKPSTVRTMAAPAKAAQSKPSMIQTVGPAHGSEVGREPATLKSKLARAQDRAGQTGPRGTVLRVSGPSSEPESPEASRRKEVESANTMFRPGASEGESDMDRNLALARVQEKLLGKADTPVKIGRFVITGKLGRGAMGVVYRAYDPKLDRKVAIKLVDLGSMGSYGEEAQARLEREAQAAATLSHPNVVTVYDVGTHEGAVFLAMEFVDGSTLTDWMSEEGRTWRDTVAMFVEIGRGLAAAHDADIVHRDFKPDNVLVGQDGRPRVADFGLARPTEGWTKRDAQRAIERGTLQPSKLVSTDAMATTGEVCGTPAYMAPEQFVGTDVSPKSDQFGFCGSLFEALFGTRPFKGESITDLAVAVIDGRRTPIPDGTGVPKKIVEIIERGLSPLQSDRYASMHELVGDLDAVLQKRRRNIVGATIGVGLTGIIGLTAGYQAAASEQLDPCDNAGTAIAEVWNDDQASAVEAAAATVSAEDRFGMLSGTLDDYAAAWSDKRTEVCRATRVDGDQSQDAMQLRMVCLDQAEHRFRTIVSELAEAPTAQGFRVAGGILDPLANCDDLETLAAREASLEVRGLSSIKQMEVFERGNELDVQILMRKHRGAAGWLPAAQELLRLGEDNDIPELEAVGRMFIGDALLADHKPQEALTEFQTALPKAVVSDDKLVPELMNRSGEAALVVRNFEAAKVYAANLRAFAAQAQGSRRAFELNADVLDAKILHLQGEFGPARELLEGLVPEAEELAATDDDFRVQLFAMRRMLGQICLGMGDFPTAAQHLELVIEMAKDMPNVPADELAFRHAELGGAYANMGQFDKGLEYTTEARKRMVELFGEDHPMIAQATSHIGFMNLELGNMELAREQLEAAIGIAERTLGPDSMEAAYPLEDLAKIARAEERYDDCIEMMERFNNAARQHLAPQDPVRHVPAKEAARCLLAKGDKQTALQTLNEALDVLARDDVNPMMRGEIELLAAQSLVGTDDARANAMAKAALERLPDHPGAAPLAEELRTFLARER